MPLQVVDIPNTVRSTGLWPTPPTSGVGLELSYQSGQSVIQSYDRAAATYRPLQLNASQVTINTGLTLNGMLGWATDSSSDIGDNNYLYRPRDMWLGRWLNVGQGIGVGQGSSNSDAVFIYSGTAVTSGGFQRGVDNQFRASAAAVNVHGFYTYLTTADNSASTTVAAYYADSWINGYQATATNVYGLYVATQGQSGVTNAYGVYIAAQSGATTTNIGLFNGGTSQLQGYVGVGSGPYVGVALRVTGATYLTSVLWFGIAPTGTPLNTGLYMSNGMTLTGSTSLYGLSVSPQMDTTGTANMEGITVGLRSNNGTYTTTYARQIDVLRHVLGTGHTVTTLTGVYVQQQGASLGSGTVTNAYGVYIEAQSGASTTNIGLYNLGTTQLQGNVGIATAPGNFGVLQVVGQIFLSGSSAISMGSTQSPSPGSSILVTSQINLNKTTTMGVQMGPLFGSSVTVAAYDFYGQYISQAASFTTPVGAVFYADASNIGSGNTVTNLYGLYVANQGATGVGSAIGVYIAAQSGASSQNRGLVNGGSSALFGQVGIGGYPDAGFTALWVQMLNMTTTSQIGIWSGVTFSSSATASGVAFGGNIPTQGATFTMVNAYVFQATAPALGAGSSVTNIYGLNIANQGAAGITNAYGVYISAQSGATTTNLGLYNLGTTRLDSFVGIATAPFTNRLLSIGTGAGVYSNSLLYITGTISSLSMGLFLSVSCTGIGSNWSGLFSQINITSASANITEIAAFDAGSPGFTAGNTITRNYGYLARNQGAANGGGAYGVYVQAQSGSPTANIALYMQTPSGTGPIIINTAVGATLTTAGAWTNAPSWAAQKNNIRLVPESDLTRMYDWLTADHQPVRYRHPVVRNDAGEIVIFTPEGDYDHFGFLLDDVPQDIREVWCVNESGGLSTKDTEGFLLAMLKVSGQRIKSLEARLAALEAA